MLHQIFKIRNVGSHRHTDANGYVFVDESPVLKAGILEYYGQELIDGGSPEIDGTEIDPDRIYKVYIPVEELEKSAATFNLLPITNGHQWLGVEGADAKNYQEGTTGDNAVVKDGAVYVALKLTGDGIIRALTSGDKEELSASYTNKLSKSDNSDYDFVASDIKGNHIALVEKGRCGPDVRVLNHKTTENREMKSNNEVKLVIDDKEIDLDKFFSQEEGESAHKDTGAITETENDDVDKRKQIDEIGGILKGKVDEELWRTIIGKVEKVAYNPSETSKTDNDDLNDGEDEDKIDLDNAEDNESACRASNWDAVYAKISNALLKREREKAAGLKRAYNAASQVMGEFNPFGLNEREMLIKALNHQGIETDRESIPELYAMLRVCNSQIRVDNGFDFGNGADEVEINI